MATPYFCMFFAILLFTSLVPILMVSIGMKMRQLIIARKDLNMSPGKLAAQVIHASMAGRLLYMLHRSICEVTTT